MMGRSRRAGLERRSVRESGLLWEILGRAGPVRGGRGGGRLFLHGCLRAPPCVGECLELQFGQFFQQEFQRLFEDRCLFFGAFESRHAVVESPRDLRVEFVRGLDLQEEYRGRRVDTVQQRENHLAFSECAAEQVILDICNW